MPKQVKKGPHLVRIETVDDVDPFTILYELLCERDPAFNISHKELPPYEEHCAFVRSHPYRSWYLIRDGKKVVGSAYLTRRNEIGVFIYERLQGKGYGSFAVRTIMRRFATSLGSVKSDVRHGFLANIAPANRSSQLFFERLGFRCVQHTYFLDVEKVPRDPVHRGGDGRVPSQVSGDSPQDRSGGG
jgi:GNAT superfamily N-acetyltransferase